MSVEGGKREDAVAPVTVPSPSPDAVAADGAPVDATNAVRVAPWVCLTPTDAVSEQLRSMYGETAFVREGQLTLRALGWEGQGPTILPGEAATTALALGRDGIIYGGTSGRRAHVFRFDPRADASGVYAQVIDLGILDGATQCDMLLALPGDGRIVAAGRPQGCAIHDPAWEGLTVRDFHGLPSPPFDARHGPQLRPFPLMLPPGESLVAGTWSPVAGVAYALTHPGGILLRFHPDRPRPELLARVSGVALAGPLASDYRGRIYGPTDRGRWFRFDPDTGALELLGTVPGARGRACYDALCSLARTNDGRVLYGGTADGYVFALDAERDALRCLGRPGLESRVCGLSVLPDGRVVGAVGAEDEIVHVFVYEPGLGNLRDLGVMRSHAGDRPWVIHQVGAVVGGPGGTIFLGEADRLSHLVVYQPPVVAPGHL